MSEARAIPRPFVAGSKLEKLLFVVAVVLVSFDVAVWVTVLGA